MANSFSLKKYLSKITAHQLLAEFIATHGEHALFEINEQTPRKLAVQLMEDMVKALDTEKRLDVVKELSYISSVTSSHTASLGKKLFTKHTGNIFEPQVECVSDADIVLYFYLRHKDIADKIAFLHPFYASKGYFPYEAKKVEEAKAEFALTELSREFSRIANKEDNATELEMEHLFLDGTLYLESRFQGSYDVERKIDAATGEINKKHAARKIETIRIAYLPEDEIVLIAGNVAKVQKRLFLDTFLRVVTGGSYEGKVERYDLLPLKNLLLDFASYSKDSPFIKASIRSATISYRDGKKKLRLSLPYSREHTGLQVLQETLNELGLAEQFSSFSIMNMTFGFIFQNKEKKDKSVNVTCSISAHKASLCPLFEYERFTKSILKNAAIYEGFKMVGK